MSDKRSYPEEVSAKIIEELKKGTAPWVHPWDAGRIPAPPVNALTGKPYRGINQLWLSMAQYIHDRHDPRWCTYRQAQQLGAQVRGGSKGTVVQYWKNEEKKLLRDAEGKPLPDENGEKRYQVTALSRPRPFSAVVFHASQIDGLPPLPERPEQPVWQRHEAAERLLLGSGAAIFHDQVNRAFYRISEDAIHLPPQEQFPTPDRYYATALHELGHWTGHESRLAREFLGHPFGSAEYAREELRAEIASYMLGMDLGIGHDPGQHHAYIARWIEALEKDPLEIIRAARDPDLIREYVMGREKERRQIAPVVEQGVTWTPKKPELAASEPKPTSEKTCLDVPYAEKDAARAAGAKWDGREKRWYAPEGADLNKLQPWLHKQEMRLAEPVLQPGAEFGRVLHESGLIIEGEPVMDGNIHRVPVEGGKRGAKDGAYCGYADGRPNGWYQNYKTGVKGKWLATGHVLTEAARTALRQQSAEYLAAAEAERQATQEKAMKRAYAKWVNAEPVQGQDHPYLTRKGIDACSLRQDKHGNLVVPGYDLETGRLQTVEYINKEGGKWYEKGCPKKGAMCILPDQAALKDSEVVLMTEGYATGASVHLATGLPVAVAFDANNLKDAAMTIKRACPNVRITICADNDARLPDARNVGLAKAKEAATAVPGCKFVTANFSPDEQKKGLTDFNDLHQARGLDAVKKSIMAKVNERETGVER